LLAGSFRWQHVLGVFWPVFVLAIWWFLDRLRKSGHTRLIFGILIWKLGYTTNHQCSLRICFQILFSAKINRKIEVICDKCAGHRKRKDAIIDQLLLNQIFSMISESTLVMLYMDCFSEFYSFWKYKWFELPFSYIEASSPNVDIFYSKNYKFVRKEKCPLFDINTHWISHGSWSFIALSQA